MARTAFRETLMAALVATTAWTAARAQSEPALKGPEVKDHEVPGVREQFADGEDVGKGMRQVRMPMPVFLDALKGIQGDEAPAAVRATPELETKVKELIQKFEADRRAYMTGHREEIRKLRQEGSTKAPQQGTGEGVMSESAAQGQGKPRAARQASLEKLRELEKGAPKVEDLYKQVWEQLSEPQRQAVDARLNVWRERAAKEREERYVQERVNRKAQGEGAAGKGLMPPGVNRPASPGAAPSRDPGTSSAESLRSRRERLMRAFEQLPPEEQERILDRLEQRLRESGVKSRPETQDGNEDAHSTPRDGREPMQRE